MSSIEIDDVYKLVTGNIWSGDICLLKVYYTYTRFKAGIKYLGNKYNIFISLNVANSTLISIQFYELRT